MPCSIITIIPLFLFVMVAGAALIYLNFKILGIKKEVDKQNNILLSFISDIKNNLVNKQGQKVPGATIGGEASLASEGALDFVNKIVDCDLSRGVPVFSGSDPIILVSCGNSVDDSGLLSSDDDSESDDDSDGESESESECEDKGKLIIEVSDVELPVCDAVALPELPLLGHDIPIVDVEVCSMHDTVVSEVASNVTDFGNMKVEQLRKIALEKLLAPTKEVNKMKKNELLALMTRNK